MVSSGMMIALCVWYLAIVVAAVYERNWARALYFVSAIGISLAVLWMSWDNGKG